MFLREQLAKWDWNPFTDAAFQHLKTWICKTLLNNTLAYYDRNQPVIMQTNANEYGLGNILIKNGWPIAFANKTLTDVESLCQHWGRVPVSVLWPWKFHIYLYCIHVIIQNDHKPLEIIQHKPINAIPCLECLLLHMQKYDFMIQYKPGKETILTNHLSHFPSCKMSLPIALNNNIQHLQLSKDKLDAVLGAVECDLVYNTLYCLTLKGWSDCLKLVLRTAWHLWGTHDELSIKDSILLKRD